MDGRTDKTQRAYGTGTDRAGYYGTGGNYAKTSTYRAGTDRTERNRAGRRIQGGGILTVFVLLLALLWMPMQVLAASGTSLQVIADKAGCAYEDILSSNLVAPGESVSDWIAIATGCSGNPVKRNAYLKGLEEYVTAEYEKNGCLHNIKATEYHRISLAVLALGGDPTAFGKDASGEPINLIAEGTYNWENSDSLGTQGLNGWIWALITIDAKYYDIPRDAVYSREDIVSAILAAQTDEGGFGLSGGSPDVDITAMALQALASYYPQHENVKGSVDRALGWLSAQQSDNGDFAAWGAPSAESTAQVVIALCSLSIDPRTDTSFIKNGKSALDGLMQYQVDGGMFRHTLDGEADVMATEQAALALIAMERLDTKANRLYDFTEVKVYEGIDDSLEPKPTLVEPKKLILWIVIGAVAAVAIGGAAFVFIKRGKKKHV